jgi:hypothetical protein
MLSDPVDAALRRRESLALPGDPVHTGRVFLRPA